MNAIAKPVIYSTYKRPERVQIDFPDLSLTKQCFQDECDINAIMKRYETSGILPAINNNPAQYGDFSDVADFHSAMNRCIQVQDEFMTLPAKVRARFSNDPGIFIDFVRDPDNYDEAVSLGLVQKLDTSNSENKSPATPEGERGGAPSTGST